MEATINTERWGWGEILVLKLNVTAIFLLPDISCLLFLSNVFVYILNTYVLSTILQDLKEDTDIDLENIVYYKDDTHYFVMTAKKDSLLRKGVLMSVSRIG